MNKLIENWRKWCVENPTRKWIILSANVILLIATIKFFIFDCIKIIFLVTIIVIPLLFWGVLLWKNIKRIIYNNQ